MVPFRFQRLELPDIIVIEPTVFEDDRGMFMEVYRASDFLRAGIEEPFVQENHVRSVRGVLRGLHYQKRPAAQGKLLRVASGEIYDVAVDIRRQSPTFGRWVSIRLSADNRLMVYVPLGFAHGYCVLSDIADVIYNTTAEYDPAQDRGILWNDPELAIAWPISRPRLSARDAALPPLRAADNDF